MVLQCRGREVSQGMHPKFDLDKQWIDGPRTPL